LGFSPEQHDVEIEITESENIIYSLSSGDLDKRNAVLKTPVKKAIQFYYLNKLKKLNELESKKADLEHSVEMKKEQDATH